MVVMILGFSKSGTSLTAKTLHDAGISFGEVTTGDYPASPYEDPEGCAIIMKSFGIEKKQSLFIPEKINHNIAAIRDYIYWRGQRSTNWGFKFPYLTMVYDEWKKHLPPDHIAIALKRKPESPLTHYTRNRKDYKQESAEKIWAAQKVYNDLIDSFNVPVIWFEDLLKNGPIEIERATGIKNLKDFRNYNGKGDGRKYIG